MDQHVAAQRGDLDWFLNNKFDVDLGNGLDQTVLMMVSATGHMDIIRLLVSRGASLEIKCVDGWSALMYAVDYNSTISLSFLLSIGASLDIKSAAGRSPCELARYLSNTESLHILEKFIQTPRTLKFHVFNYFSKTFESKPNFQALTQWNDYAKEIYTLFY